MSDWYHAYASQNGDDIVCSNCGYILGWGEDDTPKCPSCGAKLIWDFDDEVSDEEMEYDA